MRNRTVFVAHVNVPLLTGSLPFGLFFFPLRFLRLCSKKYHLAIVLNFCNHFRMSHSKNFLGHLSRTFSFIKFPNLITLLISFTFNQAIIFMYKNSCLGFNKSVFNWTFCQLLYSWKNSIAQKNFYNICIWS